MMFKNIFLPVIQMMCKVTLKVTFKASALVSLWALAACTSVTPPATLSSLSSPDSLAADPVSAAALQTTPWAVASTGQHRLSDWQHLKFPGKPPSRFSYVLEDGHQAMAATAQSSASMLRQMVRIDAADLGQVNFSWKLPDLIQQADMSLREADDSPVRTVLAFEGDRSRFSAKNAMLSELARLVTGEDMPYATLMYVWCTSGAITASPVR